jgi:hypothetical protein
LPVLTCTAGAPGGADAVGVVGGLLVALDHGERLVAQHLDGLDQKRRLAGAGGGHEVQRQHLPTPEKRPVLSGVAVVLRHDVGLDLDQALLAHAGHMDTGGAGAEMHVAAMVW